SWLGAVSLAPDGQSALIQSLRFRQFPLIVAEAREVIEHERHAGVGRAKLFCLLQSCAERLLGFCVAPVLVEPRSPFVFLLPGLFVAHDLLCMSFLRALQILS